MTGCDADVCLMQCFGPYGVYYAREQESWGGIIIGRRGSIPSPTFTMEDGPRLRKEAIAYHLRRGYGTYPQ